MGVLIMSETWLHLLDILVCTIILRALMGLAVTNRRFLYISASFLALLFVVIVFTATGLPLATFISIALAIPLMVIALIQALPEMKVILQRITIQNILTRAKSQTPELINELSQSLIELKSRREGAIIVLSHNDSLEDLIVGGESYDAKFTKSLCLSIFNPESPRHDGAVILTGNRLVHVGAVLPLSDRIQDHDEWGTRHLAALGLSERCDADVLVVSEERGTITWFKEGVSHSLPSGTLDDLRVALTKIFISKESEATRRMSLLSPALWAVSILLATLGSYNSTSLKEAVIGRQEIITSETATVRVLDLPPGLYVENISHPQVDFMLRNPRNVLMTRNRDWTIQIKGDDLSEGSTTIELSQNMITGMPAKHQVYWFDPSQIEVKIAKTRTLSATIKPLLSGLNPDLDVKLIRTEPNRKKIKVMTSTWKNNQNIDTIPVDLSLIDKPGDYIFETWINLPNAVTPEDKNDDYRVKVFVDIVKKNAKRTAR